MITRAAAAGLRDGVNGSICTRLRLSGGSCSTNLEFRGVRCPRHCARIFHAVLAWLLVPDEFGKQADGHVGLHVDVFLMFLSQDEFCVLRICEDVVARFHKNRKDTHEEFARFFFGTRDSFPEETFQ